MINRTGEYLFTTDITGYLKQWDLGNSGILLQDYNVIHKIGISRIAITTGLDINEYLFSCDNNGNLMMWDISEKRCVHNFGKVHDGEICGITAGGSGNWVFTGDEKGQLKQWNVQQKKIENDYGKVHYGEIWALAVSS